MPRVSQEPCPRFAHPRAMALAVALMLVLIACGGESDTGSSESAESEDEPAVADDMTWEDVVRAGQEEGEVTFYATLNEHLAERLIAAFEEEYGISVNFVRSAGSAAHIERLENEMASGSWQADVVNYADYIHLEDRIIPEGYVNSEPDLPEGEGWPEEFYSDGIASMQFTLGTIVYNTDIVSEDEAPADWEDLLDPQWRGQIGALDPTSNSWAQAYQFLYDEFGESFFESFREQDIRWWDNGNPMTEAVAAGELPIGVIAYQHFAEATVKAGAPVEWVRTPQAGGWNNFIFVVDDEHATNPNAAKVFVNYVLSEEGQCSYLGDDTGVSALGLECGIPLPEEGAVIPDQQMTADNLNRMRELLGLPPL